MVADIEARYAPHIPCGRCRRNVKYTEAVMGTTPIGGSAFTHAEGLCDPDDVAFVAAREQVETAYKMPTVGVLGATTTTDAYVRYAQDS